MNIDTSQLRDNRGLHLFSPLPPIAILHWNLSGNYSNCPMTKSLKEDMFKLSVIKNVVFKNN